MNLPDQTLPIAEQVKNFNRFFNARPDYKLRLDAPSIGEYVYDRADGRVSVYLRTISVAQDPDDAQEPFIELTARYFNPGDTFRGVILKYEGGNLTLENLEAMESLVETRAANYLAFISGGREKVTPQMVKRRRDLLQYANADGFTYFRPEPRPDFPIGGIIDEALEGNAEQWNELFKALFSGEKIVTDTGRRSGKSVFAKRVQEARRAVCDCGACEINRVSKMSESDKREIGAEVGKVHVDLMTRAKDREEMLSRLRSLAEYALQSAPALEVDPLPLYLSLISLEYTRGTVNN